MILGKLMTPEMIAKWEEEHAPKVLETTGYAALASADHRMQYKWYIRTNGSLQRTSTIVKEDVRST
jgi:hypothetical protein